MSDPVLPKRPRLLGGLHPKVTGSTLAGAFVGLLVAEAERRGWNIDANEAADLVVVVSFIVGYFIPNGDHPPRSD